MADTATKIPFAEAAAPSTPAASKVVIYAKSDGLMYSKDDAGTETLMSSGPGGGSVATDAIWDAKGDLAGGTGANTAQRLAVGTNGYVLTAASGETTGLIWAQPPGTILGYKVDTSGNHTTSSSTMGDVDATNAAVAFTAPASTNVLVRLTAICTITSGGSADTFISWGLRESTSNIAGAAGTSIVHRLQVATATATPYTAICYAFPMIGISAGAHTYKFAWAASAGTATMLCSANAPVTMEVIAL